MEFISATFVAVWIFGASIGVIPMLVIESDSLPGSTVESNIADYNDDVSNH